MSLEKYYEVLARYHNSLTAAGRLTEYRRLKIHEWAKMAKKRLRSN